MNREQINYTSKRIKAISDNKISDLRDKRDGSHFKLDFEKKYNFIKAGKATLKPFEKINYYTDLQDAYTFPGEKEFNEKKEKLNESINARISKIEAEADSLLDKVHLGEDAEKIIKLIENFMKKEF